MKPNYLQMAHAVARAARQHVEMAEAIAVGDAIGPSPSDIRRGAVDPEREAACLLQASATLFAAHELNETEKQQRKAG